MLLQGKGIDAGLSQMGKGATDMGALARMMNKHGSGWVGNNVYGSLRGLNSTGSWAAMMWEKGASIGHWVVVDGMKGNKVLVRDPWKGTKCNMSENDFLETWNGHSVYRQ